MTKLKDQMVRVVGYNANKKATELISEFIQASPQDKEAILAGIDFEQWLAETCQNCLEKPKKR